MLKRLFRSSHTYKSQYLGYPELARSAGSSGNTIGRGGSIAST